MQRLLEAKKGARMALHVCVPEAFRPSEFVRALPPPDWIACSWWMLEKEQVDGQLDPLRKTWLSENGYTEADGSTITIIFPESYAVSITSAWYMLVGNSDGAVRATAAQVTQSIA